MRIDNLDLNNGAEYTKNSIYRGIELSNIMTIEEVHQNIQNGKFDNLYIGDYWNLTLNDKPTVARIAGFNTYKYTGNDVKLNDNHIVILFNPLFETTMNDTATTTGGYMGSKLFTSVITSYNTYLDNSIFRSLCVPISEIVDKWYDKWCW